MEACPKNGSTSPCILGLKEVVNNSSWRRHGSKELNSEAERGASDYLLFSILPEHSAKRLKEDPNRIGDLFSNTTVLFAHIVVFTNRTLPYDVSRSKLFLKVVVMLKDHFSRLDQLVESYEHNVVQAFNRIMVVSLFA